MTAFALSAAAERDLETLWRSAAEHDAGAADALTASLYDAFQLLAQTPGMRPTRRDLTGQPVIFWPAGEWLIVARERGGILEVVGITEGPRDLPRWVTRGE